MDLGCKNNIVRCLQKRGCRVTVLPGTTTAAELAALNPDGLMLSNGPGDPAENLSLIHISMCIRDRFWWTPPTVPTPTWARPSAPAPRRTSAS